MNIISNYNNRVYKTPKAGFKGRDDINSLKATLKKNAGRVEEFAQNGLFRNVTHLELLSQEVVDAFKKAEDREVFEGGRVVIRRTYQFLIDRFEKQKN